MSGFLLVYHRRSGVLQRIEEFGGPAGARNALLERLRVEQQTVDPDVEVVALNSDSEETLRRTHSRYFEAQVA
jgi:hypothetical protein